MLEAGTSLDGQAEDGSRSVHYACTRGSLDMLKLMFSLQPEKKDSCLQMVDRNGMNPLHKAVMFDYSDIAEFLVKAS